MKLLLTFACCLLLLLTGCGEGGESKSTASSGTVATGEALFQENCSKCHPRSGRGDYLKNIPATLLTRRSQQELMIWIEGVGQHREMPSFTELSDDDRLALADYLLSQITQ